MVFDATFDKFACQIFLPQKVFVVKSSLRISYEDIIEHVGCIMQDPDFYVGLNGLYDFTDTLSISGSKQALYQTAEAMNSHELIDKVAKTAIWVPDDNVELKQIFVEYTQLTATSLIDYRVFNKSQLNEMLEFLELDEMPIFSLSS